MFKKNVLRGLHFQIKRPQAKIITVTHGKIFDVAVDLRKKSKNFGKYVGVIMSDKSDFSFYIQRVFLAIYVSFKNVQLTINVQITVNLDLKVSME